MSDFYIGTLTLLVSNVLLSAYPVLIKLYILDVSVLIQLIIRITVYICLSLPFLIIGGEGFNILTSLIQPKYLAISAINLIHIYSSYKGFEYLNSGIALTTFYSYPIIQVILSKIFLGTKLTSSIIYGLLGSLVGIGILNKDSYPAFVSNSISSISNTSSTSSTSSISNTSKGFLFIAIAAITEAIIGVFYKGASFNNPFMSLYTLYAPAFLFFMVWYIFYYKREVSKEQKEQKKDNWMDLITNHSGLIKKIIIFNLLIGGLGYTLRLFSLTKIPISWFSGLTFTSSLSAFLLGWLFLGEKIKLHHLVGSIVIFYNIYKIKLAL
jgi:drug/metabolite transporter (DMT)-like permease